jgi:uncharacterized protein (TIGR02145 family)
MNKESLILCAFVMSVLMFTNCGISSEEVVDEATPLSDEVKIGNQVWMTVNLSVDKFRNGDPIPHAQTNEEWRKSGDNKQPAWCYYDNNPENEEKYGKLYNWHAVNDPRGLAPEGWKIPSDEDWSMLTGFLDGESGAGKKIKYTDFWADDYGVSGNGTNESGFSALPGGHRFYHSGAFLFFGEYLNWWSSSSDINNNPSSLQLNYNSDHCELSSKMFAGDGLSVRCLRVVESSEKYEMEKPIEFKPYIGEWYDGENCWINITEVAENLAIGYEGGPCVGRLKGIF